MKRLFVVLFVFLSLLGASCDTVPSVQTGDPYENPYFSGSADVGKTLPDNYVTQAWNPYFILGRVVKIALSFLGVGALSLLVYSGYTWMTAAGNDDKITEAKKTMSHAAVGLILIMMSYSLTWYVVARLQRATNTYGTMPIGTFGDRPAPWEDKK
ncbi:MAG: hypothetical protein HY461_01365 [Parcubacteria group bacterium]|nr:hypothetical protein [Parcubacteria group bacterium]